MDIRFKPSDILRKKPFTRLVPGVGELNNGIYSEIRVLQSDFLREYDINGHRINDRNVYKDKVKQVEVRDIVDGVEKVTEIKKVPYFVERVAVPYQSMIATKQLTAITGNNVSLLLSEAKATEQMEDMRDFFVQGWMEKDMEIGWYEFLKSDKITGDTAFCGYIDDGKFGWSVFSFADGNILYPHYDRYGRMDAFGRQYSIEYENKTIKVLDVWDKAYFYSFRQGDDSETQNESYDGWTLSEEPTPHGFPFIPVAYYRTGKPCWGDVQNLIDKIEMAYSRLAENNKAFALRILFTKGADLAMRSTLDGSPTAIHAEGEDCDAKFLEPADESTSFKMEIDALEDAIYRGSFTVKTPEVRGSDLSGLAVELLFTDSSQKAICDAQEYKKALNEIINIFKWGYGIETGRSSDMQKLRIFGEVLPYMPKSETEEVSNIVQLKSVGALSQRTASEISTMLGYGKNAEYQRIVKEERDKLIAEEASVAPVQNQKLELDQKV